MALSKEELAAKERMQTILRTRNISLADFADHNETDRVRYTHHISGSGKVPFDTLYKFLYENHDVSAEWIILGEGPMIRTTVHPQIFNNQRYEMQNGDNNSGNMNVGDAVIPYPVQALLDEKDKRIAELEKDKTQLQGLLAVFTRQADAVAPKKK